MLLNLYSIASQVLFCFFIRKVFEGLWPLNFKYRRKEIRNFIHLTADSIITWTKTTIVVILLCCCIAVSKVMWRDTMHLTYNLTTHHSSGVLSKIMSYPLAACQRVAWNPRIRRQYRHYGHIMDTGPARSRPLHTRGDGAVMISTRPRPDAGRGRGLVTA